jgi:hypothetical protein
VSLPLFPPFRLPRRFGIAIDVAAEDFLWYSPIIGLVSIEAGQTI